MKIPKDMIENLMQHRHGGNGWAVVAAYPDDWVRAVSIGKSEIGKQFFLFWNKCLSLEKIRENQGTIDNPRWVTTDKNVTIHHTLMDKINDIRAKLANGTHVVNNTRLEKVKA